MADDRPIAPSPSRWRRAWQAGLRPKTRWLWPAVACGVLAAGLDRGSRQGSWGLDVRPGSLTPDAWLEQGAGLLGVGWGLAGALVLALAWLTGRLGGISGGARRRLRAAPSSSMGLRALGFAVASGLGITLALRGVLAGAARAVDASEAGLVALWTSWAGQGLVVVALGLGLVALGELVLDRSDRRERLAQSRQQARDDARASGAR
ncbi:MAG: hypothetical protein AAGF11_47085 [Myxococcota bacterium]